MPIPGPGPAISLNTLAAEFGGTVPHSLSEYYRGGGLVPNIPANLGIPTSGTISLNNFYGSSARVAVPIVISSPTATYDIYVNRGPAYVAGLSDVTLTVNPGVTVRSGDSFYPAPPVVPFPAPTFLDYAILIPTQFSPTDNVTIVNNGTITGKGGLGGAGGRAGSPPFPAPFPTNGQNGFTGGAAIRTNRPVTIFNNSIIAGGGGGGGGGGGFRYPAPSPPAIRSQSGGGGGGGGGTAGGAGGPVGQSSGGNISTLGSIGGATTGGAGGAGPTPTNGVGGVGGAWGSSGNPGTQSVQTVSPFPVVGAGGSAGNYVIGNSFVTWGATGTRLGNFIP